MPWIFILNSKKHHTKILRGFRKLKQYICVKAVGIFIFYSAVRRREQKPKFGIWAMRRREQKPKSQSVLV